MEYLSHREVQLSELNILKYFHSFCEKNNLRYSLVGGTLLGAVRHKGFIPWDDDIDVGMPRPDYEKFKKLKNEFNNNKYQLCSDEDCFYPFSKIYDTTISISSKGADDLFLWIDVFPFDGISRNDFVARYNMKRVSFLRRMYTVQKSDWMHDKISMKKILKYLFIVPARIIGVHGCKKRLIKIASKFDYSKSEYVAGITWGVYGLGERIVKKDFENIIDIEFEDNIMKCMSCWNEYLTGCYGDYMKLPPENKRMCHTIKAVNNQKEGESL